MISEAILRSFSSIDEDPPTARNHMSAGNKATDDRRDASCIGALLLFPNPAHSPHAKLASRRDVAVMNAGVKSDREKRKAEEQEEVRKGLMI